MANPLYGQNKADTGVDDLLDLFSPNQIGKTEGKGFVMMKGSLSFAGGDTTSDQGEIINIGTTSSVWAGVVRVEGIEGDSGSLDFDLGLTAEAADFGAAYGTKGDGIYGLKLHEYVSVGSEGIYLSIDGNTVSASKQITVTVILLTGIAPASS
jgi:hypothetical protein|tara:strand:- start:43 stop:501 length:459 start_codon:yes stop_codon:yes gene_type:complete